MANAGRLTVHYQSALEAGRALLTLVEAGTDTTAAAPELMEQLLADREEAIAAAGQELAGQPVPAEATPLLKQLLEQQLDLELKLGAILDEARDHSAASQELRGNLQAFRRLIGGTPQNSRLDTRR